MSTRPAIKVAAVQLNSQQDIDANLNHCHDAIAQAAAQGVDLLVLPENFASMGRQHATAQRFNELSQQVARWASHHHLYVVAGSLPCLYRPDGTAVPNNRLRQASQLFAPDGSCVARYDKIHLFTATVADSQGNYDEAETFEPGAQTVVAPLHIGECSYHIGMMVCFDLRFPALAQRLRQAGADILTAPSAFTYLTGQAHWRLLLRARALDSQCLVIGAAQGGTHQFSHHQHGDQKQRQTWGHATIAAADATVLNEHEHSEVAEDGYVLLTAQFEPQQQQQMREQLPIMACHRLA